MSTKLMIKIRKAILPVIAIVFASVILTGCGIGQGPTRYGYNGYHGSGSGNDYRNSGSYNQMYGPGGGDYHRDMNGNRNNRGGYCGL